MEDGRHIVTMDLPKKIKSTDLEKGAVCEFTFDSLKAPLSKKTVEYLSKEKRNWNECDLSVWIKKSWIT